MIPPIFASFIVLSILIAYEIKKSRKKQVSEEKSFWEKERMANSTRRKSLENLEYISIPLEEFPISVLTENETVRECLETITSLHSCEIVNFTGISNTDLKLQYGVANLTLLTEYDQNYTLLVRTLQKWADCLYDNGFVKEACTLLEYAVSIRSDISHTYSLLISVYKDLHCPEKIPELLPTALSLNSAMKNTIVQILEQADPYND